MTDTTEITDADIDAVLSGADSAAPFGRFKNGKPRKKPAGPVIPSVPGPRRNAPRSSAPRSNKGQPDYRQLSANVLQLPVIVLGVTGQVLQTAGRTQLGTSLALDGMTVGLFTEQIADVGKRMAEADGRVARWLERYGKGGVYGEAIALAGQIGAQMMVNHGRLAAVPAAGLLPPDELYRRAQEAAGMPLAPPVDAEPADAVPGG